MKARTPSRKLWQVAAIAVLAGLVAEGVMVGVIGYAAAGESPPPPPATFGVPSAREGDQGVYTHAQQRLDGDRFVTVAPEERRVSFGWNTTRDVLDGHGQMRRVLALDYVLHRINETGGMENLTTTRLLDPATGAMVALEYSGSWIGAPGAPAEDPLPPLEEERSGGARVVAYEPPPSLSPFEGGLCGARNAFQGRALDIRGPLALFPACTLHDCGLENLGSDCPTRLRAFQAAATEEVQGVETVKFMATGTGPRMLAWFTAAKPYPVRLAAENQSSPGVFDVYWLAGFEAGEGKPLPGIPRVRDGGLPALEYAPRAAWGPSEAGLEDHPFLLSEAWEVALAEDAEFAAFLEEHPGAYLASATFSERATDDVLQYQWNLGVTDGVATNSTVVVRETRSSLAPLLPQLPVPYPGAVGHALMTMTENRTYVVENGGESGFGRLVPPSRLPATLPTVASLMEWWQVYAALAREGGTPRAWGFTAACLDEACADVQYLLKVGVMRFRVSSLVWPGLPGTDLLVQVSELAVFTDGGEAQAVFLGEGYAGLSYGSPLPDPLPAQEGEGEPLVAASLQGQVWPFTPEVVAATGLVALVVAVLTYLKSGGLSALYARLMGEELLHHPTRARIVALVAERPGIYENELVSRLDLPRSQARFHLRVLARDGIVVERKPHGYKCYTLPGSVEPAIAATLPVLQSEAVVRVLAMVQERPGISNAGVARALGVSAQASNATVLRCREAGLVAGAVAGREVQLSLTELGRKACAWLGETGAWSLPPAPAPSGSPSAAA